MGWFDRWFGKKKRAASGVQANETPPGDAKPEATPAQAIMPNAQAASSFGVPFEVIEVAGEAALGERTRLQQEHPNNVVLLLGNVADFEVDLQETNPQDNQNTAALSQVSEFDFAQWSAARISEDPEYYDIAAAGWPEAVPTKHTLTLHLDGLTQQPQAAVAIGLLPVQEPWQAPIALSYGGWNECPLPAEHAAIHRRWQEQYGAVIASISGDVIECTVDNPPQTQSDALQLAREQFVYCPDLVLQGTDSIEALAAALLNASVWTFWWD